MLIRSRIVLLLTTLFAVTITACGTISSSVVEQLDSGTGVTVTRSETPMLFYRDNSRVAAYAREYVNAGPVMVNRMGEYRYFLWLGIWSTHGAQTSAEQRDAFESAILVVDGEPIVLDHVGWSGNAIGVSESVYQKPVATSADAYYLISRDQLRLITEAHDVRVETSRYGSYEPWDDQQQAKDSLRAFLDYAAW